MKNGKPGLSILNRKTLLVLGSILMVSLCLLFLLKELATWAFTGIYDPCSSIQTSECKFTNKTPEDIFIKYVWESIPSNITEIEGVEGIVAFSEGPAFVRFKASDEFITELIEKDYDNYSLYSVEPCTIFYNISSNEDLIQDFSEKFEWWRPSEVISPVCYKSQGRQSDDSRHLLIDFENGIVYFYRTATCGLCPD